ncbi:hypothetical protein AAEP93_009260 [Penicillium crustosum]
MTVKKGQPAQGVVTITYTVRDEDGFYNVLQNDYGILKDWVIQYNKPQGEVYHSWLKKAANDDIKVPNLKSVIETTVPNITTLQAVILGSFTEMRMGATDASDYSHTHAV